MVLVGKPDGRRRFGRPGRRWDGNIKMDFSISRMVAWTGSVWLRTGTGGSECGNKLPERIKCGEFTD